MEHLGATLNIESGLEFKLFAKAFKAPGLIAGKVFRCLTWNNLELQIRLDVLYLLVDLYSNRLLN